MPLIFTSAFSKAEANNLTKNVSEYRGTTVIEQHRKFRLLTEGLNRMSDIISF